MSNIDIQKSAANYMGAIAHALGGRAGRQREFIDKVEVILSGSEPHALRLMQFPDRVRSSGRPVMWIHHMADVPTVPLIGLVAPDDGQIKIFENCMLWMPAGHGRIQLVPDSFTMGAFRFDDELRLRHIGKAPASSFEDATPGMKRAYERLLRIEVQQRERGDAFELPTRFSLKQAA